MKATISLLIFTASFLFGCHRVSEQGVRQLSSNTASPVVNSMPPNVPLIKRNTAIVTSQHANLRTEDNASAAVKQTVPQDSLVEVIKQQGAWYLVKTETNEGWMHGSTIRLQNFDIKPPNFVPPPSAPTAPQKVQPPLTVDLRIKGNRNSMIYHLPQCASYDRIAEQNIVWFRTKEEAEAAGYRMARNC